MFEINYSLVLETDPIINIDEEYISTFMSIEDIRADISSLISKQIFKNINYIINNEKDLEKYLKNYFEEKES